MSEYRLEPGKPSDAEEAGKLFAQTWTNPFTQLQFKGMSPEDVAPSLGKAIVDDMGKPRREYWVVRNLETGKIACLSSWSTPADKNEAVIELSEEEQEQDDEAYRAKLPPHFNIPLMMDFRRQLRDLRGRVLKGRRHFGLENLATSSEHRRKGLASQLIQSIFPRADTEEVVIYLDTDKDDIAINLYRKLGFVEVDEAIFPDLSVYGGNGSHSHIALVREPEVKSATA